MQSLCIGSSTYYPRIFSAELIKQLNMRFYDTPAFRDDPVDGHMDCSLPGLLEDIERYRQTEELRDMVLIGHSIHALMALVYAAHYPQRVSRLILIASSPITGPALHHAADQYFQESVCPERKLLLNERLALFQQNETQSFVDRMLAFGPMLWFDPYFDASMLWKDVQVNPEAAAKIWGPLFENFDVQTALQAIQCPVWLALGRYDYFNPPWLWEAYRQDFRQLTLLVFERSGHTPPYEEAALFDRELLAWV
jgi:proline iminopeptidase